MSLTLNGFHQDKRQQVSLSLEQTNRLEGPLEDWPDWSQNDVGENKNAQSVHIHIQPSKRFDTVSSRLAHETAEEEPWDDFEDPEVTSDLSPTAPSADSVILPPPSGSSTHLSTSADQTPEESTLKPSKPLKLTSVLHQSTQNKSLSSWDDDWSQKKDFKKPLSPSAPVPKSAVPMKSNRTGGLGEEFTIKVKKKVEQDPELDLFADMVPDIKLSSAALLPLEETISDKILGIDSSIDIVKLTAKFAAANPSEVSFSIFIKSLHVRWLWKDFSL